MSLSLGAVGVRILLTGYKHAFQAVDLVSWILSVRPSRAAFSGPRSSPTRIAFAILRHATQRRTTRIIKPLSRIGSSA